MIKNPNNSKLFHLCVPLICLFSLSACKPPPEIPCGGDKPGIVVDASFSIWEGIDQVVATAPSGNKAALSCHNCYSDKDMNIGDTIDLIGAAIDSSGSGPRADLIELDIQKFNTDDGIDFQIVHLDPLGKQQGPSLVEVLSDETLSGATQPIFVEIKPWGISEEFASKLVQQLTTDYNDDGLPDYARTGRPLVVRASTNVALEQVRRVIENDYPELQNNIYLSRLFLISNKQEMDTNIQQAAECGFHMVEFRDEGLALSNISIAKSIGLAVNIFTLTAEDAPKIEKYRDLVDAITVEVGEADGIYYKPKTLEQMTKLATARESIELTL